MSLSHNVTRPTSESAWKLEAMEHLVAVVQELSHVRSIDEVVEIVRVAARSLTGADGATFVLRDGDQCYYVEENAIAPLWKGRRFPMSACISGWVMLNAREAVIEDIYADPRIPADAYQPTFVKSLAMVPIRRNAPIGAIGNYWKSQRCPTPEELAVLQALADTTSVALENAELYGRLCAQVDLLQEQRTRIEQQRDTVEVFARALAHDLKEPARTLKSFSRIVLDDSTPSEQRARYLQFIHSAADRMDMLVHSVLRFMQCEDPAGVDIDECPMQDVLHDVQANLAELIREHDATIAGNDLPTIHANRAQMMQVLQNLIANAIVHNEAGITIRVSAEANADCWQFTVADNGRGIANEHVRRIFEPFQRLSRQDDCAGLGLATCEKIISRGGGTIWCESTPGLGANFRFTVPRSASTDSTAARGDDDSAAGPADHVAGDERPRATMLLVDDRPDDLELSLLVLKRRARLDCHVRTAHDGKAALRILAQEPIDVVLLDINMPGMDGFEVLEHMNSDPAMRAVPVIMCTGSTYDRDQQRSRELGAVGYIVKPLSLEALRPILGARENLKLVSVGDGLALLRSATCAA